MSDAPDTGILELIGAELRKQIALTFDAGWKEQVAELAKAEDREYKILSAFTHELTAALDHIRRFPARYRALAGKADPTLPANIARYRAELQQPHDPVATREEWNQIKAQRAAADSVFAAMLKEISNASKDST